MTPASLILSGVGAAGAVRNALAPFIGGAEDSVSLGSVVLSGFAAPERMNWGGQQQLTVHKFPGGKRQVDAMGRDDDDIRFSGHLVGRDRDLAGAIDAARIAGARVVLAWNDRVVSAVIRQASFADDGTGARYDCTCVVVRDLGDADGAGRKDLLGQIVDDIGKALTWASAGLALFATGQAIVTGLAGLQAKAEPMAAVTVGSDDGMRDDAAAVQAAGAAFIAAQGATVEGAVPGDPDQAGAVFLAQVDALAAVAAATIVVGMAGRIAANLGTVTGRAEAEAWVPEADAEPAPQAAATRIVVAGGDLYRLAALYLRDATQWVRIAVANGMDDPLPAGVSYIAVPDAARPQSSGLPDGVAAL